MSDFSNYSNAVNAGVGYLTPRSAPITTTLAAPNALDYGTTNPVDSASMANIIKQGLLGIGGNTLGSNAITSAKNILGSGPSWLDGFGKYAGIVNAGIQGIGTLANIWGGIQQLNLAKQALAQQENAFNFNKAYMTNDQHNQVNAANLQAYKQGAAKAQQEGLTGQAVTDAGNQRVAQLGLQKI